MLPSVRIVQLAKSLIRDSEWKRFVRQRQRLAGTTVDTL